MPRFSRTTCEPILIKSDLVATENAERLAASMSKLFAGTVLASNAANAAKSLHEMCVYIKSDLERSKEK